MNITRLVTGPLSVNTWCVPLDERRAVVVDPGGDSDSIIAHLAERHFAPALIFLTHGHLDHLLGIPGLLRVFPGLPVAIHPGDAFFLGPGSLDRHREFFGDETLSFARGFQADLPAATVSLGEGEHALFPGWEVLHTPGHSAGSVCLYNAALKTLVAGDTLFKDGVGRTDFPGSSVADMGKSLDRLSRLPPDTEVLPGHGAKTIIGREFY